MKLIITIKPSAAKIIAKNINANVKIGNFKKGGYYQNNDFVVTCYTGYTLQYIPDNIINASAIKIRPYAEIIKQPEHKNQYNMLQRLMHDKHFDEIILFVDDKTELNNGIFHYLYKKIKCVTPYRTYLLFDYSTEEINKFINERNHI